MNSVWSDATLILLGHGTARRIGVPASMREQADIVRRRELFARIEIAFWKKPPLLESVLAEVSTPQVCIVPMFLSGGHYAGEAIPRTLGLPPPLPGMRVRIGRQRTSLDREGQGTGAGGASGFAGTIVYCPAIGIHRRMADVIRAAVQETVAEHPLPDGRKPADLAVILAAHGSRRHPGSRRAAEMQADRLRAAGCYADVIAVFLEESPGIEQWHLLTDREHVVVIPFFMGAGRHSEEDIPMRLGIAPHIPEGQEGGQRISRANPAGCGGRWIWLARPVGLQPGIAGVIAEIATEAADEAARWSAGFEHDA